MPITNPCFTKDHGPSDKRVFITTIPKSGTYLIGEIVKQLGFVYSGVLLSIKGVEDHRGADPEIIRTKPQTYYFNKSFADSSRLILPGQYTIGHIPWRNEMDDFSVIFATRNLRTVVASCTRYYIKREKLLPTPMQKIWTSEAEMSPKKIKLWFKFWGREYSDLINDLIESWSDKYIFSVKYEKIDSETIQMLSEYLDCPVSKEEAKKVLDIALATYTPTLNKKRTSHLDYWDDEVENLFQKLGFAQAESKLQQHRKILI